MYESYHDEESLELLFSKNNYEYTDKTWRRWYGYSYKMSKLWKMLKKTNVWIVIYIKITDISSKKGER